MGSEHICGTERYNWLRKNIMEIQVANRGMKIQICTNNKNAQDLRRF